MLDFIGGHRRVAVAGTAGSGKTLVAMEATRRLARQGFRVLYTCYTKALAAWVQESLHADLGPLIGNVTVDNYHDLAARYVTASGGKMPVGLDSAALNIFFQDELPSTFWRQSRPVGIDSTRSWSMKGRTSPISGG